MKPKIEKNRLKTQVYGLTGGIAAGKSKVGQMFEKLGIPCLDADRINAEVYQDPSIQKKLVEKFGTAAREKIRDIVFQDASARRELESLVHPAIQKLSEARLTDLAKTHPIVVYEATLLIETGRHQDLKGLIVVTAPTETRTARLGNRPGMNPKLIANIIANQSGDDERVREADHVLVNEGSEEELFEKVEKLATRLRREVHSED